MNSPRQTFPKAHRVLKRRDFLRIQSIGEKFHTKHFMIALVRKPSESSSDESNMNASDANKQITTKIGITVTRKVGNAVKRNRIRRVVREVFRKHPEFFPKGEVILIAKKMKHELSYVEVCAELRSVQNVLARGVRSKRNRPQTNQ